MAYFQEIFEQHHISTKNKKRVGNSCEIYFTYSVRRWVKFPILGESEPDNPILAISLPRINNQSIKIISSQFTHKKKWWQDVTERENTHREITKPSEEQPTMYQVQGSTEFISHPSKTWCSSLILFFIDISAATAYPTKV